MFSLVDLWNALWRGLLALAVLFVGLHLVSIGAPIGNVPSLKTITWISAIAGTLVFVLETLKRFAANIGLSHREQSDAWWIGCGIGMVLFILLGLIFQAGGPALLMVIFVCTVVGGSSIALVLAGKVIGKLINNRAAQNNDL